MENRHWQVISLGQLLTDNQQIKRNGGPETVESNQTDNQVKNYNQRIC